MSNQGTQEQNRNRNNRNRNRNRNRGSHGNHKGNNPNQRPQSQHQKFVSRKPVKLTFWQKLLKMIGLYKEPTTQKPQQQNGNKPAPKNDKQDNQSNKSPRSNTRDTRKENNREPRPPRERKPVAAGDIETSRLYVGNLSYETTESDLEELFKGVGPVRSVEIVYNKHTHKSKGYGFVEMLRIDEAKNAVEVLHDQPFMGRNLIVSGAKAKEDQPQDTPRAASTEATASEEAVTSDIAEENVVEEVHSLTSDDTKKETFA